MKKFDNIIVSFIVLLLSSACSNTSSTDNAAYPDDEDILYIESDSLLAESQVEEEQISRHKKLSKGYRRTFNDKNDVHLVVAQHCELPTEMVSGRKNGTETVYVFAREKMEKVFAYFRSRCL